MKTWIDFDSPVYAIASACDGSKWNYKGRNWDLHAVAKAALLAEGKDPSELYQTKTPEPWDKVVRTIDKYCDDVIHGLEDPFNATLLVGGGGNFRFDIATIQPYKGNRVADKPFHFDAIKDYIVEKYEAKRVYGVEVDDAIGVLAGPDDLIISQDKDLLQLPGNHKHPTSGKDQTIDDLRGLKNFYSQMLLGDSSDNIPGIFGIGSSSTFIKQISEMNSEEDIYNLIVRIYNQRFGSYYKLFLLENARLLWLIRNPNRLKEPLWFNLLKVEDHSFYYKNWEVDIFVNPTKS